MDPTADWISLKDKYYKLFELYKMASEFKSLEINHSKIAIARHGGPIAITRDPDHIVLSKSDDPTKENICIYTNNGELMVTCPNKEKEKIIGFDFIEDEYLLVVWQTGTYILIDPHLSSKKSYNIGSRFETEKILEAKIFDNGFAFYTIANYFYFVKNVFEPHLAKFVDAELPSPPKFFIPISPKNTMSERVEVQISHPDAGIILLIEDECKKIYYNSNNRDNIAAEQLPNIPKILKISISPNHKFIAYLTEQKLVHVVSADFSPNTHVKTEVKDEKKIKNMVWCSEDCVALISTRSIELVGPDVTEKINMNTKGIFAFAEVDGIKVISNTKCEILRRLSDSYVNIFKLLSFEPGALLYEAYNSFENRNPLPDEDIRNKKNELANGVLDCINAGAFELYQETQSKLLKAASYGKAFLSPTQIDHNLLGQVCKFLRVVHNIKNELYCRTITYAQLKSIDSNVLIKILLRYRAHYLANEICKFLDFPQKLKSLIYIDWARCKVECQESDEHLCYVINQKLKDEKGVSFTEIAHRAIEIGKTDLATKLLEYEPSISKKVPILLWMEKYEKALEDAIQSRDSNLIYMVILKLVKSHNENTFIYNLMSSNSLTTSHIISYYRNFSEDGLYKYLEYLKLNDECGFSAIYQAYNTSDLTKRLELLRFSADFFKNSKDHFYYNLINDQIDILKEILKTKAKNPTEKPISTMLDVFLKNKEIKTGYEFKKMCKIPDRRFSIIRIKNLIKNKEYDELEKFVNENNKKGVIISYELIADLLLNEKEDDLAEKYLLKINDVEEQINMLKLIGRMKKATEVAIINKKNDILHEIRATTPDEKIQKEIDLYFMEDVKK